MTSSRDNRPIFAKIVATLLIGAWLVISVNCETFVPRNGWSKRWGPMVPHKTFPGNCGICHVPERWDVLKEGFSFDHEKETGYRLEGAHASAACLRCHNDRGPVQVYNERGCGGCHPDPHKSALGMDCTRCHDQLTWRPAGLIAEHARTRFPLFGAHVAAPCERCHERAPAGDFRGAPVECDLCHRGDLARATSPNHLANGWTRDCQRCHLPGGWSGANFSHDFFPLIGGHGGLQCIQCHTSGTHGPIPSDCFSCHQNDFQTAPNHVAGNFSHDCTQCHSIFGWDGANFNHSFFPLTGGHSDLQCSRCHVNGNFTSTSPDCYSCHQTDYQQAPNHSAVGFPQTCAQCHNTTAWSGATFNHSFPLQGPHNVACATCHLGGTASNFTCLVCHAHNQTDMDAKHRNRPGYSYNSNACYQCHPNGK